MALMDATRVIEVAEKIGAAYNEGDREAFRALLTDDVVYWEAALDARGEGPDAVTDLCFRWKETWPDLHSTDDRITPIDGGVVWEMVWRGTATGPFTMPDGQILPPSGKPNNNAGCMIVMIRDGKICEMRHYFDALEALRSAGAFPG